MNIPKLILLINSSNVWKLSSPKIKTTLKLLTAIITLLVRVIWLTCLHWHILSLSISFRDDSQVKRGAWSQILNKTLEVFTVAQYWTALRFGGHSTISYSKITAFSDGGELHFDSVSGGMDLCVIYPTSDCLRRFQLQAKIKGNNITIRSGNRNNVSMMRKYWR